MSQPAYTKFGIHIKAKDLSASFKYYTTLGFKAIFAYGPEDFLATLPKETRTAPEKYRGVTFEVGDALFEIGESHPAVKPEVFQTLIPGPKVSAMIDVDSLDNLITLCKENQIDIAKGPTIYPWGTTELVLKDPDGFILVFRELTAEYSAKLTE